MSDEHLIGDAEAREYEQSFLKCKKVEDAYISGLALMGLDCLKTRAFVLEKIEEQIYIETQQAKDCSDAKDKEGWAIHSGRITGLSLARNWLRNPKEE